MARRQKTPVAPVAGPRLSNAVSTGVWPGLALLGLTLLVYFPALSCGFIWDDDMHLTENPCIVGPLGFADIWTSAYARICPLVQSTFWLEYRLFGLEPMPYHLVNLLFHAATAIVLWRVLRILRVPGAWLGAALWVLHPVQVESVAWITELKNTQSGLFFVLAVLFFCRSRLAETAGEPAPHKRRDYTLAVVFAAMALASKSSTVVLPVVCGLCAWWIDRGWHWRRNLLELTPMLVLSIAAGLVTIWTQKTEGAFDPEFARGLAERLAAAGKVVWFYAGKLAWPDPLIFIYPRWRIDPSAVVAWLPALAAAAVMIVFWWQRGRWARGAFFAAAYFVVALGPVLGLIDTYFWRYSFVGDHFQYLASMGPLAFAGAGVVAIAGLLRVEPRWFAGAAGALLLVVLGVMSWRQCAIYKDEETLWVATLRLNPESWIAHNNYGVLLSRQPGRSAEAIVHFEEALRIHPRHAMAHYNLAKELAQVPGRQADAIAHFEESLRIDPSLAWSHLNFGALLAVVGRQSEAIAHYEEAQRLMPDSAEVRYNLAIELKKIPGRRSEVVAHYREALRLRPEFPEAHFNLAFELASEPGAEAEAIKHFEEALRLRPDWPAAHNSLAILFSKLPGRLPDVVKHFEEALRLRPEVPLAHFNLAGAYYKSGRPEDAIRHLEKALELDPGYEDARRNLAAIRQQMPD